MTRCLLCGHAVSKGDKHSIGSCPPPRSSKRRRKHQTRLSDPLQVQRGEAVAGTGKPKEGVKK